MPYKMSYGKSSTPGSVLKAVREAARVTQMTLAVELDVSLRTVQRWEKDELTPSAAQVFHLADYFEIKPRDLVKEEAA